MRFCDQCPSQRHPLFLTPRKLVRVAGGKSAQLQHLERLFHLAPNLELGHAAADQSESHIVLHGQMWKQRVTLEHGVDGSHVGGQPGEVLALEYHTSPIGQLEARDNPQKCGFPTPGRAKQGQKFSLANLQAEVAHRVQITETLL